VNVRPGIARCPSPRLAELEDEEKRLEALLAAKKRERVAAEELLNAVESCVDVDRCTIHAAFKSAIVTLDKLGWSRSRTAQHFNVSPTTIHEWFTTGDRQRKQLPAWILPGIWRLPEPALNAFKAEMTEWRFGASFRTGSDG
jgi:hypothetical protein